MLWKACSQNLLAVNGRFPGDSSPCARFPNREAWCGDLNLHTSGRTSLELFFYSLWFPLLAGMGFHFPMFWFSCLIEVSSLSLEKRYLFLVSSSILLSMVIQQLVAFWCSLRRRRAHDLLLHYLEREAWVLCSFPGLGGGHGNPLQCSCLENPVDRGAWRATVHGVPKSQTRLKRLSRHTGLNFLLCSVARSCLPHCSPMDSSMPGFPVLHYHSEFAQVHVHWVTDAI